jgi:hypothetical protein
MQCSLVINVRIKSIIEHSKCSIKSFYVIFIYYVCVCSMVSYELCASEDKVLEIMDKVDEHFRILCNEDLRDLCTIVGLMNCLILR